MPAWDCISRGKQNKEIPLHDAAVKIGMPEAALVVCAMDKAYMTGFRRIEYTRTTSVAEGGGVLRLPIAV